ncbi:MAG: AI-2E family transporter [Candidatus Nanohaloarchaeota archaeon QJJ-7]|nr:AI-2E family transporter [Candidatus Nanohaloarchaeota archaeon QJJ-7]
MRNEHVFLVSAALSGLLALWILWPFSDALLWAGFTAYLLHYLADRIDDYLDNRKVTNTIVILILAGFVMGLAYFLLTSIPTMIDIVEQFSEVLSGSASFLIELFDLPQSLSTSLQNVIENSLTRGRSIVLSQLTEVPAILIHLVIYFVVAAYLVKDGKKWKQQTFEVIGKLPDYYRKLAVIIIQSIDRLLRGVFITYLAVAAVVGLLATVGFFLLGVDFYWGWGLIIGIFAFFPIVSAPMVYIPLSLLYIGLDQFWIGAMLFAYGVIVLNVLPEVFFRPYLAAHQTEENPLLLFAGFIMGPLVLGFKGIILGPIILVIAKDMLSMKYLEEHS